MSVKKIVFQKVASPEAFYGQLKQQVILPKSFGANLDALFDFLSTDLEGPAEFTWQTYNADVSADPELRSVRGVLLAAMAERKDIKVTWG